MESLISDCGKIETETQKGSSPASYAINSALWAVPSGISGTAHIATS